MNTPLATTQTKKYFHEGDDMLSEIVNLLSDKKAHDIVLFDLSKRSTFARYMIIANGQSSRQVLALAGYVEKHFKNLGLSVYVEGQENAEWVLVFAQDIAIHIFTPEKRGLYALDTLWADKDNMIRITDSEV
ncbi:MAG: ribosome silencing factor [Alphaproteobacteria bacterium]|nr:ribosome silencing factor [Alphaproteobacteria bacterium]